MSMTARAPYRFAMFSDDYFRTINPTGVRQLIDPCGLGYQCCWDTKLGPDGTLYFAPSDASGNGRHTRLVSYDYQADTARICFKAEDVILPNPRQLPATKLHESLTPLPDGRIFATTHSTDRAPQHPEWMPFGHYTHVWEGWPGSTMLCYDPASGRTENWGVPVPRESIYGATYDARHHAIYMIGFMRGHVYRYALDTHTVKDLGKAAEIFCYRLHPGPDGHIYGCTKSGYLWRVNVDTERIEDLNWRVPEYPDNYCNNTWYRYLSQGYNVDEHTMLFSTFCSDEFFRLNIESLTVTPLGYKTPFQSMVDRMPLTMGVNEFAVDSRGVLWYAIGLYQFQKPEDDFFRYRLPDYLMRWDYLRGAEPECLGAVGTVGRLHAQTSSVCIDRARDLLYMVDGGGHPGPLSVVCIDLTTFEPQRHTPGPVAADSHFQPIPMTPAEITAFQKRGKAIEEVTEANPFYAFPIERITPIRLWRSVPHTHIEDSRVIGLVWDAENVLHGLCGEHTRYTFTIRNGQVDRFVPLDEEEETFRSWLLAAIYPRAFTFDMTVALPEVVGRRYLASPSAMSAWNNARTIVGTRDGLLAIVSDTGVYALGNAAPYGPVRCLYANAAHTRLWGTAGDDDDLGTVFYYDDHSGLRQLGHLIYNIHGYFDGPSASNILSSIAVSPDETLAAVGGADRMGAIHIATLP